MQMILCKINQCPFHSSNGFCLNRMVVIDENGGCKYITSPKRKRTIEPWEKSTWIDKEQENEKKFIEEEQQKENEQCNL